MIEFSNRYRHAPQFSADPPPDEPSNPSEQPSKPEPIPSKFRLAAKQRDRELTTVDVPLEQDPVVVAERGHQGLRDLARRCREADPEIFFASTRADPNPGDCGANCNHEIYVMKADGSDARQLTKEDFRLLNNPYWSPDGPYPD